MPVLFFPAEDFGVNLVLNTPDGVVHARQHLELCDAVNQTSLSVILDKMVESRHISSTQADAYRLIATGLLNVLVTENHRAFVGAAEQSTSSVVRRYGIDGANDWRRADRSAPPRDGSHFLAARGPYDYYRRFFHDPPAVVHWWQDPAGAAPTDEPGFYLSHGDQGEPFQFEWWRPLGLEPRADPREEMRATKETTDAVVTTTKITVNGKNFAAPPGTIGYWEIARLAGQPHAPDLTVTYWWRPRDGQSAPVDAERCGTLHPVSGAIKITDGMVFSAVRTGSA